MDKERFTTLRNVIMQETDDVTQAAYYFALNRCSFSGATLSGGFSKEAEASRFNAAAIDRLKGLDLRQLVVRHAMFPEFLESVTCDDGTSVLFLDPPYLVESKLYGMKGDMHDGFDHDGLAAILRTMKRWMLCYNDCERIRSLYSGYKIIDAQWSYGMNKTKKSSEIIILSVSN